MPRRYARPAPHRDWPAESQAAGQARAHPRCCTDPCFPLVCVPWTDFSRRDWPRGTRPRDASSGSAGEVGVLQAYVVLRGVIQRLDFLVAEHAYLFRRVAQPQLALANHLAGRDERTGPDETVLLHHRAIEQDRAHADQHRILDAAGMDDRLVTDGHVLADHGGEAAELGVRAVVADMHHGAVLDVGARAHADEVDVAADDGAGPDRDILAEDHIADHGGGRVDVAALAESRHLVEVGADVNGQDVHGHGVHGPIVRLAPEAKTAALHCRP